MNNFLEKNLNALKAINPTLVDKISRIKENSKYEVFIDSDPANINIIDKERNEALYISKPIDEVLEQVRKLKEYTLYPYLYFFGFGNGVFYKLLLGNTTHKRIVVVEPELEIIYISLHFVDFSKEIESMRFMVMHTSDCLYANINSLISYKDAKIFSKLYELLPTIPYYNHYEQKHLEANRIFIRAIEHNIVSVGNDTKDSLMGLEHHILNLPFMLKNPTVNEFVKKCKNTNTAIIVSTGPSLAKQLPLLKEIQDYATLLCIDASFPILQKWGIKPDVVISLERIELTSVFYKKTPSEFHDGVIFAITSIVHKELRDAIKGGTITMSARPFGYTRYFDFNEWGYLGIGMSAANMAYEIAVHSRFDNVIFIGQDLAYSEDGDTHSSGYVLDKDDFKPNDDQLYIESYGGRGVVRTNDIWKLFLNFFETDIAKTPYKLNIINSTEGGARIAGTLEVPFVEAVEKLIDKSHKKEKINLISPSESEYQKNLELAKAKILEMLEYGYKIKKEVEELFLEIAKETENLENLNQEQRLEEIDFEKIKELISKIDDIKDYFLDSKFLWIFIDAIQSYIIHQELDIAKIQVLYTEDEMKRKAKLLDWLYAHKYWLFSLAGGMNAVLEITKRAALNWMEFPQEFISPTLTSK